MASLLRGTRTIVCVGRNYAAHARELGNAVPSELFYVLKPGSALVTPQDAQRVVLPRGVGEVHHEAELALMIGSTARRVRREHALRHVAGFATAIDVTGRDLQNKAKKDSLPGPERRATTRGVPSANKRRFRLSATFPPSPSASVSTAKSANAAAQG